MKRLPSFVPVETLLAWATKAGFIPESILVVGRRPDGRIEVGNAGENGRTIVSQLRKAADMIERGLRPVDPCDLDHTEAVRLSTDNEPISHGPQS